MNLYEIENNMYNLIQIARETHDVPIAASIFYNKDLIAQTVNIKEKHAEMILIENINKDIILDLFVTLEPCPMCLFNISLNKRIKRIFFGAYNRNYGACGGKIQLLNQIDCYKPEIFGGILENQCAELLKDFFLNKR